MDMRRKATVLLAIYIFSVAVASLIPYAPRPTGPTNPLEDYVSVSVCEILQHPSAWVNKTVAVEGNLSGSADRMFIPEKRPLWIYELTFNGSTIGLDRIGRGDYSSTPARIYGVVRERRVDIGFLDPVNGTFMWPSPSPHWISYYYIEAERIELLSTVELTSVDEIILNPLVWVNKTVVVEGVLSGPFGHVCEDAPPWDYCLGSNGTIGVLWRESRAYISSPRVRIRGVVRQGVMAAGIWPFPATCYYIEAETIDIL